MSQKLAEASEGRDSLCPCPLMNGVFSLLYQTLQNRQSQLPTDACDIQSILEVRKKTRHVPIMCQA